MLHGYVYVLDDLILTGKNINQFIRDAFRIAVQHTDVLYLFQLTKRCQQFSQLRFSCQILTVTAGILCNQNKFLHAHLTQLFCFFYNAVHRTAAETSPYHGDSAIGTVVIAAFRNFQISIIERCGTDSAAAQG